MPARIARASVFANTTTTSRPIKKKTRSRALNAFAIASVENPDNPRIRKSRFGHVEDDPRDRKKRKVQDQDHDDHNQASDADEDDEQRARHKGIARKANVGSSDAGSDSEGNAWVLGHVASEDDSEIDSDAAFDQHDEQRFAGFSFSASKKNKRLRTTKAHERLDDLNLEESAISDDDDASDQSLGEDAVDLVQMLDDYSASGSDDASDPAPDSSLSSSSDGEDEEEEEDDFSDISDEADHIKSNKLASLSNLVSSLHPSSAQDQKAISSKYESMNPSEAGITMNEKIDIKTLFESGVAQPQTRKHSSKKSLKLAPALPKLHQDKLDRQAANEKAKKTLDRWIDTVKHMRRTEHVTFPLQHQEARSAHKTGHLLPVMKNPNLTSLEATISNILQESGLGTDSPDMTQDNGHDDLPNNHISVEEILHQRAQLRRARELIFREEQKSKRIKKIKSKSYRRVHRKERERLAASEKDAFDSDHDIDDEEREVHDRRRAEERMGAKHRDSKWAKQMKKSGRSIWDDDARSGVTDMARRNEELRKRMAGDAVAEHDGQSQASSDDDDEHDSVDEPLQLLQSLKSLNGTYDDGPGARIASMKFMQRADAARKSQNDEDIKRIQQELNGEEVSDHESDKESVNIGRHIFGPSSRRSTKQENGEERNEFEEPDGLEDESADSILEEAGPAIDPTVVENKASQANTIQKQANSQQQKGGKFKGQPTPSASKGTRPKEQEIISTPGIEGWRTVTYDHDMDSDDASDCKEVTAGLDQAAFLAKAFAGDDVEAQFATEKEDMIVFEDDKITDETLPGWGSWVGEGISKRQTKRDSKQKKASRVTKQAGTKRADRKDAELKHVIISEKRIKKNSPFLASTLPFPFTSKQEYERSIRMPVGGEWNVKRTVAENVKPRVIVKPGRVILPLDRPLV